MADECGPPPRGAYNEPWVQWASHCIAGITHDNGDNTASTFGGTPLFEMDTFSLGQLVDAKHPELDGDNEDDLYRLEEMTEAMAQAYAKRIVLCVNACKGLTNSQLEKFGVRVGPGDIGPTAGVFKDNPLWDEFQGELDKNKKEDRNGNDS